MPQSVGASKNTVRSYKYAFQLLIAFMFTEKGIAADRIAFDDLDFNTLTEFFEWIEGVRKCSAATKNQRLSALVSFSSYAQNRDFAAASVFRSSVIKIPMKKAVKKQRSMFTIEEVTILLTLPDDSRETGLRDKVLLSVMYATGARAQEIYDLTVGNIQFTQAGASLNITGKGGKTRRIGISGPCAGMIKGYLIHRKIEHKPDRHVFSSQTHERMTVSCIEEIFKKYVGIAKKRHPLMFQNDKYTPHAIRHTTAGHMLEAGVPLMVIKNFLGHVSIQTTQIYAELSQNTVDKHLLAWNERWFPKEISIPKYETEDNKMPDFLKT
jgi:site-specific recombinase XerD